VNRERLIQVKCPAPYDSHYAPTDDVIACLEALGMVIWSHQSSLLCPMHLMNSEVIPGQEKLGTTMSSINCDHALISSVKVLDVLT